MKIATFTTKRGEIGLKVSNLQKVLSKKGVALSSTDKFSEEDIDTIYDTISWKDVFDYGFLFDFENRTKNSDFKYNQILEVEEITSKSKIKTMYKNDRFWFFTGV